MNCSNCSNEFVLDADDKAYYEKNQIPQPSWCPICRLIRKMAWCNEGILYPGECSMCKKNLVTQFSSDNTQTYYCVTCWWSDQWNVLDYGRDIDWDRSILEQIHELELEVPHGAVSTDQSNENSEYIHHSGQARNSYLVFHGTFTEDCYYAYGIKKSKDCVDVHYCHDSELCYESIDVKDCYGLAWSQDCVNCSTSAFLYDSIGSVDCFMSVGLRNKKHFFMNEQLSKEEYDKRLAAINMGSFSEIEKLIEQFEKMKLEYLHRPLQNVMIEASTGDHLKGAKNAQFCFDCSDIEDSKYCFQMQFGIRFCRDIYQFGVNTELCYESAMVGTNAYNVKFSYLCLWGVSDLEYCMESYNSKNCFASVGLNHNEYCILNKQYSEEEYIELKAKLIEKMKADGEYGEFFPVENSQSAYNESIAQLWYPMTKEQVIAKGWRWQDKLPFVYGKGTGAELPNDIKDVDASICEEVLDCAGCKRNFKIIPQELRYYKRHTYPLPRFCFECRRFKRLKMRNPRYFWNRKCLCDRVKHGHAVVCNTEFSTTYSPKKPDKVVCDACYKAETY